jgi:ketosteroid isomerase-like protein
MKWSGTAAAFLLLVSSSLLAQGERTPSDVVDAFHKALRNLDTAGALSLLDRGLVVFEFGLVDAKVDAYGLRHMPHDMDLARETSWKLETRRTGGEGNDRWVLSTYRVTGKTVDSVPIDHTTLETVILRRSGAGFRIVHLHWSSSDNSFQEKMQRLRAEELKMQRQQAEELAPAAR